MVIENKTSKDITYRVHIYPNVDTHMVKAHSTNTHAVNEGLWHGIETYTPSSLPESIYLVNNGDVYTFNEVNPITVNVYNSLSKDANLFAEGYLSTEPLVVEKTDEAAGTVCTKTPKFSAKTFDGYPIQVNVIFDGTKYMITLQTHL
jgi:hypothetical protein